MTKVRNVRLRQAKRWFWKYKDRHDSAPYSVSARLLDDFDRRAGWNNIQWRRRR